MERIYLVTSPPHKFFKISNTVVFATNWFIIKIRIELTQIDSNMQLAQTTPTYLACLQKNRHADAKIMNGYMHTT